MAAADRYQQTQMVMHQLYKARISGKCIVCGGPKKHPDSATCLSLKCLRAWLPGKKEAQDERAADSNHHEETAA
jgi:hypothetical protein